MPTSYTVVMQDPQKEARLESVVSSEKSGPKGLGKTLATLFLAVSIGAAGYGIRALESHSSYLEEKLTKPYVLKITEYGIRQGYADEIWKMFPEDERYRLIKKEIVEMPVSRSWEVVRPAIEEKIKYEWQEFKKDVSRIFLRD
jgi:hypothetical protein